MLSKYFNGDLIQKKMQEITKSMTEYRNDSLLEGKTLVVWSGWPMSRMHLQRVEEFSQRPALTIGSVIEKKRVNGLKLFVDLLFG